LRDWMKQLHEYRGVIEEAEKHNIGEEVANAFLESAFFQKFSALTLTGPQTRNCKAIS